MARNASLAKAEKLGPLTRIYSAKAVNHTPISLIGFADVLRRLAHQTLLAPLLLNLLSGRLAFSRFFIEGLCHTRRATLVTEPQNSEVKGVRCFGHGQTASHRNGFRRFDANPIDMNVSTGHRLNCEGPCFVKPRSPQPFVDT